MLILGIETSCDDTAAAVVKDGSQILSSIIASQDEIHSHYGGIVPELASRRHLENINPVIQKALSAAAVTMQQIDAIAITQGPGLLGALLVGISVAKGLAEVEAKPLIPVHHLHGHILAAGLENSVTYPHLCLVVSGGHTTLFNVKSELSITEISSTRDDAAGEAFDKVAKMLGLGFPGGPAVEQAAKSGDASKIKLTLPRVKNDALAFSFSGLKTAVRNLVGKQHSAVDIAAAFQATAVKSMIQKTMLAAEKYDFKEIVLAGGVACNGLLRQEMKKAAAEKNMRLLYPEAKECTDNGAMIARAGYYIYKQQPDKKIFRNNYELDGKANLPIKF